jgi:hypothetical protein
MSHRITLTTLFIALASAAFGARAQACARWWWRTSARSRAS